MTSRAFATTHGCKSGDLVWAREASIDEWREGIYVRTALYGMNYVAFENPPRSGRVCFETNVAPRDPAACGDDKPEDLR